MTRRPSLTAVQIAVSFILFFGSRRFHSTYGFFSDHVDAPLCRRGSEWIPSVLWQFLWATVFGPILLVKIRHIHDVHHWALQTRLAILACLPGTPLWLAFTYSSNATIAIINKWFIPAGWFLPSLFTMQAVSIIISVMDALSAKRGEQKSAASFTTRSSDSSIHREKTRQDYSMASLEMQIEKNVDPLLRWAATKEFTAENIVFLRAVRDFKRKWHLIATRAPLADDQLRERYEEAARIYFTLVNPLTAKFNINVDYRTYHELESMFSGLRYEPYPDDDGSISKSTRSDNVIAPWADIEESASGSRHSGEAEGVPCPDDVDKLYPLPVTEIGLRDDAPRQSRLGDLQLPHLQIPPAFSLHVFDKAYESVKHDVFLNTWVRYEAAFSKPRRSDAGGLSMTGFQSFVRGASGDLLAEA